MPFVTVQLTREGTEPGVDSLTPAQKSAIFHGMSQVLLDVLGKPHAWTWVVIEEIKSGEWGLGGKALTTEAVREIKESVAA